MKTDNLERLRAEAVCLVVEGKIRNRPRWLSISALKKKMEYEIMESFFHRRAFIPDDEDLVLITARPHQVI